MAEPGCGGLPYFITGHCISRTLGSIEVEAEPEALSPMLKDRWNYISSTIYQGTVSQERWDQMVFSLEGNQCCFAGGLEQ